MLPSTLWSPSLMMACSPRSSSASVPPLILNGGAVELERVGGDADAVRVEVVGLHRVVKAEPGVVVPDVVKLRGAGGAADGQLQLRRAVHLYRFVELDHDLDRVTEAMRIPTRELRQRTEAHT